MSSPVHRFDSTLVAPARGRSPKLLRPRLLVHRDDGVVVAASGDGDVEEMSGGVVADRTDRAVAGGHRWSGGSVAVQGDRVLVARERDGGVDGAVVGEVRDALVAGGDELAGVAEERDPGRADRRDLVIGAVRADRVGIGAASRDEATGSGEVVVYVCLAAHPEAVGAKAD